jgi:hypothetical protein
MAPGAQSDRMRAGSAQPHRQGHLAQSHVGVAAMDKKQEIAIGIVLQTQVLRICPIHNQLYCDDEIYCDDENMARAFAVATELVRQHEPYSKEFNHDAHELTDLLSHIIGATPVSCPDCVSQLREFNDQSSEARAFR